MSCQCIQTHSTQVNTVKCWQDRLAVRSELTAHSSLLFTDKCYRIDCQILIRDSVNKYESLAKIIPSMLFLFAGPIDGPFPSNLKNMPYLCYQVPSKGPCNRMEMVWFFDVVRRKCLRMFYSGCGGNENRFRSQASCELTCRTVRRI